MQFYDEVKEFYEMMVFDRDVILRRGYDKNFDLATYIKNVSSDLKEILDKYQELA